MSRNKFMNGYLAWCHAQGRSLTLLEAVKDRDGGFDSLTRSLFSKEPEQGRGNGT